jgi:hypothetical protein
MSASYASSEAFCQGRHKMVGRGRVALNEKAAGIFLLLVLGVGSCSGGGSNAVAATPPSAIPSALGGVGAVMENGRVAHRVPRAVALPTTTSIAQLARAAKTLCPVRRRL